MSQALSELQSAQEARVANHAANMRAINTEVENLRQQFAGHGAPVTAVKHHKKPAVGEAVRARPEPGFSTQNTVSPTDAAWMCALFSDEGLGGSVKIAAARNHFFAAVLVALPGIGSDAQVASLTFNL